MTEQLTEPRTAPVVIPMTQEQLGLLLQHRADPDSSPYNVPLALDLRGPLEPGRLQRALDLVIERHPLLSARVTEQELPRLELRPAWRPVLLTRTVELPAGSRTAGDPVLYAESRGELDLEGDGVLRALLLRHAADHHTVLLVVHHLVIDGESSAIVLADLVRAYRDEALPDPAPAAFADYVHSRQAQADAGREALTDYWRQRLAAADLMIDFPLDGPGHDLVPADQPPAAVPVEFTGPVAERLGRFARGARVGRTAVVLAAYLKALATYSRQGAPTVGVPLGMRGDPGHDLSVGYFVRTLLVGTGAEQLRLPAREFVRAVQTDLARAVDRSALPFPQVARLLPGDAGDPEVFNCTFVMHSWADSTVAASEGVELPGGLRARWLADVPSPGLGLLTLELYEAGSDLRGRLKYDASCIEPGTARLFAEHLCVLVEQLVSEPDRPVSELTGLGPDARAMLGRLNDTDRTLPATDINSLLGLRIAQQPDRVALEEGERTWTYRQLDEAVQHYAGNLRAEGAAAGDRIGLMVERSAEAVLAILAVLRIGAAYVPIDGSHPRARREHIVRSSGLRLAVVAGGTADRLPDGVRPVPLERLAEPAAPGDPVRAEVTGDTALHVLYTSGSTGLPKGVQLSHRALAVDALAAVRYFELGPADAMVVKAPFTFDVSAHEMLVPLVAGGRLVVAPADAERDPDLLAETLVRHRVTLLHAVPSQLRLLIEARDLPAATSLRAVVSTGESLPNELRRAFEAAHPAQLHNAYGPTETSYSTVFSWQRGDQACWTRRAEVPIGVPFDNIRCYVLDDEQRLLPPGAPGELWIGGGTVSDGYVGDPGRTADRYRHLDTGDGYAGPCYRTGDLVRLLPNGALTHLGRLDDQVKINGNRVELGEVRAALAAVPGVEDATVQVARHPGGSLQIIAWAVPRSLDPTQLRRRLAAMLPSHMVPVRITAVQQIPLLPNGKTDRQALAALSQPDGGTGPDAQPMPTSPAPEAVRRCDPPQPDRSARTGTIPPAAAAMAAAPPAAAMAAAPPAAAMAGPERAEPVLPTLRRVWAALLGPAADDAQFFESGGDSILAMQLISRLRRAGVSLVAKDLYRHPVLADLAAHLDATGNASAPAGTPVPDGPSGAAAPAAVSSHAPARSGPARSVSPLAPVQSWFFRQIRTDRHQWNQSVLLELDRPIDASHLRLALQAVIAAHPTLSARFEFSDAEGGRMLCDEPFARSQPRDVLWQRRFADEAALDELLESAERSLAPMDGVHVRGVLATAEDDSRQLLLIAVHHLVMDGVSWRIVLEDLEAALDSLSRDELPRLPDEACDYLDWIEAIRQLGTDAEQARPWLELADRRSAAESMLLTTPAPDESGIRRWEFSVDGEATQQLIRRLPARLGLTVHQVMAGAFGQALARWRGSSRVSFDVETHGRHGRDDLYRTVGWFTSIHPVLIEHERSLPAAEYVAAAGRTLAELPEGGVSFGACREFATDPDVGRRLLAVAPALACFNYYGQADQLSPAGRFRMSGRPIPREHSAACERVYAIEVYGIVHDGRLRLGFTWVPSPADGVDEASTRALVGQLRWVLAELSGAPLGSLVAEEIVAAGAVAPGSDPVADDGLAGEVPVTPQQQGLLLDALAHPGTGRYVEQLFWNWHGPLDTERFSTSWQEVCRREAVLRSSFRWDGSPRLLIHRSGQLEVTRYRAGEIDWDALRERERLRGFALDQPGLVRVSVLDTDAGSARVLVTFHHVLLDGWSISRLIQDFYRAYLDGASLPAGERRPDLRELAGWLGSQDIEAAERFWARTVPAGELALRPALPGPATGEDGTGRAKHRLNAAEADRLRSWASAHAATESTAIQLAWSLLLSRTANTEFPVNTVSFGITVSGRRIELDGVEQIPGLLMNTLPVVVEVGASTAVTELLAELQDRVLDCTQYEWVSTGQIHQWSGRGAHERLLDSLIVVENYPRSAEWLERGLAENGIRVDLPDSVGSETAYPVTLLVYRDVDGSLVLDLVHDRSRLSDAAAATLVRLCAGLLHTLPSSAATATVAELHRGLTDDQLPRMAERATPRPVTSGEWPAGAEVEVVVAAWRNTFDCAEVHPGDHFFDSGGHSLLAMKLLRELSERTGRQLRLDELLSCPTAGQLAALLGSAASTDAGAPAAGSLIVPLRAATAPRAGTLVLLHPPGGQVACYAQLAGRYPGSEQVLAVRDPRVDDPQPAYLTVPELVERYLHELQPVIDQPGPLRLGGFSGGGVLAYELAQRIRAARGELPQVLLIDAGAPDGELTDAEAEGSFSNQLRRYLEQRDQRPGPDGRPEPAAPSAATGDTADPAATGPATAEPDGAAGYLTELGQIADWMRSDGGGDPVLLMRDSVEAIQRYQPEPYPGPVVVLRAGDTSFGRGADYDESDRFHSRAGLGWEDHCQDLTIRIVPGNHVSLMTGENAVALGRALASTATARIDPA